VRYEGLLLDIDNTLYDYGSTHKYAIDRVIEYCIGEFTLSTNSVMEAYAIARKKVHIELSETASSHNRLLYFQKMLELLNINSLEYSYIIYNIYWDNFIEYMKPFDGIYKLLEKYKNKICLVTDLTAHIQYRKIKKLKLEKYCTYIVTSEEAGKEKPHPYMFMLALHKLNMKHDEVCMIGDSFKKDIFGASNLDIDAIWLNSKKHIEIYDKSKVIEVEKFKDILEQI